MTSVPKPLKFLSPHYPTLKELFEKQTDAGVKVGDFLSKEYPLTKFFAFVIDTICRPLFSHRHGCFWGRRLKWVLDLLPERFPQESCWLGSWVSSLPRWPNRQGIRDSSRKRWAKRRHQLVSRLNHPLIHQSQWRTWGCWSSPRGWASRFSDWLHDWK